MRIAAHTLGCKLNNAETSTIVEQFRASGFDAVGSWRDADVFLLNTCSVTANAEKECRQLVRRVLRENPEAFVAVTGCYAQLRPEEIASIEGVDAVFGAKEKFDILSYINPTGKFEAPKIFSSPIEEAVDYHLAATSDTSERTRAFLKVQDGCDYTCTYCTIPQARGASRSADVPHIISELRRLSRDGFHEVVLSGVNVGDFGQATDTDFYDLCKAIEADDEITARIRISSIEPNLLRDEIIELVANSKKFCPHFHIPLQSGSDRILRLMQRRYNTELYRSRIERVKELMPHAGIGVDVIVGFPDERDEDFLECKEFLDSLDISYLHVFSYSERPGTKALSIANKVPKNIRSDRSQVLRMFSEKKKAAFYQSQIGSVSTVLLEDETNEGFTENYVRVRLSRPVELGAELVRVMLSSIYGEVVIGDPIEVISTRRADPFLIPLQVIASCP